MIVRLISDSLVRAGGNVSSVAGAVSSCALSSLLTSFWSDVVGVVGVPVGGVVDLRSAGLSFDVSKLQLPKHDAKLMAT